MKMMKKYLEKDERISHNKLTMCNHSVKPFASKKSKCITWIIKLFIFYLEIWVTSP